MKISNNTLLDIQKILFDNYVQYLDVRLLSAILQSMIDAGLEIRENDNDISI